jgi:hypothetical protein
LHSLLLPIFPLIFIFDHMTIYTKIRERTIVVTVTYVIERWLQNELYLHL